ncbi:MAG: hypothetical protein Q8S19_08425 [Bacillota bacterium]|nr:hypothetical protein [Bacillota bacterium]
MNLATNTGKEKAIIGVARVITPGYKHDNGGTAIVFCDYPISG